MSGKQESKAQPHAADDMVENTRKWSAWVTAESYNR